MAEKILNPDEVAELVAEINLEILEKTKSEDILIVNELEKGNLFFAGVAIYDEDKHSSINTMYKLNKHITKEINKIKILISTIKL